MTEKYKCHKCGDEYPDKEFLSKFEFCNKQQYYRYFCNLCMHSHVCMFCPKQRYGSTRSGYMQGTTYYGLPACKDCMEAWDSKNVLEIYTGRAFKQKNTDLEQSLTNALTKSFKELDLGLKIREIINEELYKPDGVGAELAKQDFEKKAEATNEGL